MVAPMYNADEGPTQGGTVPGQRPGGSSPAYNMFLESDKAARLAAVLDRLGLGSPTARRNVFGQAVGGRVQQVLDPWLQTQMLAGGDMVGGYDDLLNRFVGYMSQGGGGLGAVAEDARLAAQTVSASPDYSATPDAEMIAMLNAFNQLASQPLNPWLQRAYGNLQDESVASYYTTQNRNGLAGNYGAADYLGHLQDNPLFGFLTGQGR